MKLNSGLRIKPSGKQLQILLKRMDGNFTFLQKKTLRTENDCK